MLSSDLEHGQGPLVLCDYFVWCPFIAMLFHNCIEFGIQILLLLHILDFTPSPRVIFFRFLRRLAFSFGCEY